MPRARCATGGPLRGAVHRRFAPHRRPGLATLRRSFAVRRGARRGHAVPAADRGSRGVHGRHEPCRARRGHRQERRHPGAARPRQDHRVRQDRDADPRRAGRGRRPPGRRHLPRTSCSVWSPPPSSTPPTCWPAPSSRARASAVCNLSSADDAREIATNGVVATIAGRRVVVGKRSFVAEHASDVVDAPLESGQLSVYVSVDGAFAGTVILSDRIRDNAAATLADLAAWASSIADAHRRCGGDRPACCGATRASTTCAPTCCRRTRSSPSRASASARHHGRRRRQRRTGAGRGRCRHRHGARRGPPPRASPPMW